jgi:hypothetical protein
MNGDEIEKLQLELSARPFDRLSKNEFLLLEMIFKLNMRVTSLETERIIREIKEKE